MCSPTARDLWLDAEDSLSVIPGAGLGIPAAPHGEQWLRVAAIRLPRISNSTDIEALACEPGVAVHWVTEAAELAHADIVVIPGSKATVADLQWLGISLGDAVVGHARAGEWCWASAEASRCCADTSTMLSRADSAACPGWACSTQTSPSVRTRNCAAGKAVHCPDTRSATGR